MVGAYDVILGFTCLFVDFLVLDKDDSGCIVAENGESKSIETRARDIRRVEQVHAFRWLNCRDVQVQHWQERWREDLWLSCEQQHWRQRCICLRFLQQTALPKLK